MKIPVEFKYEIGMKVILPDGVPGEIVSRSYREDKVVDTNGNIRYEVQREKRVQGVLIDARIQSVLEANIKRR